MPDFSSLAQLLDAQPAKMTDQITVLNALLVLKLRMVVREKLLLPRRYGIPPTPSISPPAVEEDRSGRFEVGPHLDFAEEVGDEHGLLSAGSRDPRPHVAEGAADIPSMAELFCSDDEDVAPAVAARFHRHQLPGALILYEFACDPNYAGKDRCRLWSSGFSFVQSRY